MKKHFKISAAVIVTALTLCFAGALGQNYKTNSFESYCSLGGEDIAEASVLGGIVALGIISLIEKKKH